MIDRSTLERLVDGLTDADLAKAWTLASEETEGHGTVFAYPRVMRGALVAALTAAALRTRETPT